MDFNFSWAVVVPFWLLKKVKSSEFDFHPGTQGPPVAASCARATRFLATEYDYIYQNLPSNPLWPQRPSHLMDLHILTASVERDKLDLIHYRPLQWRTSCGQ